MTTLMPLGPSNDLQGLRFIPTFRGLRVARLLTPLRPLVTLRSLPYGKPRSYLRALPDDIENERGMAPKKEAGLNLKVRISRDLMQQVNEYRFTRRLETRKDAVIELLTLGLNPGLTPPASHSQDSRRPKGDGEPESE